MTARAVGSTGLLTATDPPERFPAATLLATLSRSRAIEASVIEALPSARS